MAIFYIYAIYDWFISSYIHRFIEYSVALFT